MLCKVSELSGDALDWAVATAAKDMGFPLYWRFYTDGQPNRSHWGESGSSETFRPSTRGDHAHPIIERERITLRVSTVPGTDWAAFYDVPGEYHAHIRQKGPTALIAAMRCFVNKHLGDEVDIPDQLKESDS